MFSSLPTPGFHFVAMVRRERGGGRKSERRDVWKPQTFFVRNSAQRHFLRSCYPIGSDGESWNADADFSAQIYRPALEWSGAPNRHGLDSFWGSPYRTLPYFSRTIAGKMPSAAFWVAPLSVYFGCWELFESRSRCSRRKKEDKRISA